MSEISGERNVLFHDAADDTVALYVAGTLPGDDEEVFERHLLDCALCREEVRLGLAIRSAVWRHKPRKYVWAYAGAALAATGLLVAFGVTRPSKFDELASVSTAPDYGGVAVRVAPAGNNVIFEAAMQEYRGGAYRDAALTFERARSAGSDSVVTTFFRAASLLLSGNKEEAAEEFRRVTRFGRTAYLGESHYYLAKSLLSAGKVDAALNSLGQAASIEGPVQGAARALADSIVLLK